MCVCHGNFRNAPLPKTREWPSSTWQSTKEVYGHSQLERRRLTRLPLPSSSVPWRKRRTPSWASVQQPGPRLRFFTMRTGLVRREPWHMTQRQDLKECRPGLGDALCQPYRHAAPNILAEHIPHSHHKFAGPPLAGLH